MGRIPEPLRRPARAVRDIHRRAVLARAVASARRELAHGDLSPATRDGLRAGWGNPGWAADSDYLEHLLELARGARRPVLECGSGLSTLLLALLAERTGVEVISLEHVPAWRRRVEGALARFGLAERVRVLDTPLVSRGDYAWYDLTHAPLPAGFDLVGCDGPPGDTPGGRYGLWPELRDRIDPATRVLVDDAHRPAETEMLARWEREFGVTVAFETGGRLARVTPPAAG